MSIWNRTASLDTLNAMAANTLAEVIGIVFIEIGPDYLVAKMPVDKRTHQPFGLLHGGASAALAETIGSVAGWLCINPDKQYCVGMELNCNHIKGKTEGWVYAKASSIHLGGSTQVWDIRIYDENQKIVCVSRLTMAVIKKLR